VGTLTIFVMGLLMGYVLGIIFGSDRSETSFLCGVLSSPNTTSLPLIYIEVLYPLLNELPYDPTQDGYLKHEPFPNAHDRGLMYIALSSIISNIWRWTISYNLINPRKPENLQLEEGLLENDNNSKVKHHHIKVKDWGEICHEILNAPIIVSIITLLLCLNGTVKNIFISDDSIVAHTLLSVNLMIATSYKFAVMFLLGLNFANLQIFSGDRKKSEELVLTKYDENYMENWKIGVITFSKLIINPILGFMIILLYKYWSLLHDEVIIFYFLFTLSAPNAINIIIICNIKETRVKLISILLVVQYIVGIFSLTLVITLYLYTYAVQ
jgi:predicted permease